MFTGRILCTGNSSFYQFFILPRMILPFLLQRSTRFAELQGGALSTDNPNNLFLIVSRNQAVHEDLPAETSRAFSSWRQVSSFDFYTAFNKTQIGITDSNLGGKLLFIQAALQTEVLQRSPQSV